MEFRKRYTLTLQDYLSYNLYSHRKQFIMMPIMFLVLMLAVCIFIVFAGRTLDILSVIVVVVLILLFAGLIAVSNIMMLNRQARRRYLSS